MANKNATFISREDLDDFFSSNETSSNEKEKSVDPDYDEEQEFEWVVDDDGFEYYQRRHYEHWAY